MSRCPSATSCIHLVLNLVPPWPPKVPPTCASQQLPAFMRFQYLPFPTSSLHSFLHAPSFWVQYLDFRFSSQQFLAFILVSMSNFPLSHLPLSHQFSAVTWLQYLQVPPFLSTPSCIHPVSISKFRPPGASQLLPAFIFWVPKIPPASASLSFFCVYLHVSSFSFNV